VKALDAFRSIDFRDTGYADDLVHAGNSGLISKTGVVEDVAEKITSLLNTDYGRQPSEEIGRYSFESIYSSLHPLSM
jgi:hypothetical protein